MRSEGPAEVGTEPVVVQFLQLFASSKDGSSVVYKLKLMDQNITIPNVALPKSSIVMPFPASGEQKDVAGLSLNKKKTQILGLMPCKISFLFGWKVQAGR